MNTPDFALVPPREPSAQDEIIASLDRISVRIDELLREREHIARVLYAFYKSDISISSLQPILDLCVEICPSLKTEPR